MNSIQRKKSTRDLAMFGITLFKMAVFIASLTKCYCQDGLLLSTILEKSVENINLPFSNPKERCVEYLNSNLNEFLQKLERQSLNKVRTSNDRIFELLTCINSINQ